MPLRAFLKASSSTVGPKRRLPPYSPKLIAVEPASETAVPAPKALIAKTSVGAPAPIVFMVTAVAPTTTRILGTAFPVASMVSRFRMASARLLSASLSARLYSSNSFETSTSALSMLID